MAGSKKIKIDDAYIESLPDGVTYVERGLFIRKRGTWSPVWIFVYSVAGKRREISLGPCKTVKLKQAQDAMARYRTMLLSGVDPVAAKKEKAARLAEKISEKPPQIYTVNDLISEAVPVVTKTKRWRNEKHAAQWWSTLQQYAAPKIGHMDVKDVTRDDILSVLSPIWETKTETASRLRGRLEAIFSYAIVTGKRVDQNPCIWKGNLQLFLAPPGKVKPVEHHDALTFDEAKELLSRWMPPKSITASAIVFGALTCARVGEFIPAKWDEIDFDERVWMCPAERRKDGRPYPHRVPLSDQVIELLNCLPRKSEFIFPGNRGYGHLCKETPRAIIIRAIGHGTMHGLRSTFRDWAAENGWSTVLAEKSLMHATGNAVEQAYQRSDLLEQRRPLLQAWADAVYPKHE